MLSETVMCTNCVLTNEDDPEILFDHKGVCHHCTEYYKWEDHHVKKGAAGQLEFSNIIASIKDKGKGNKYDCILGLSGGVDSSYLALVAAKAGLRPLAVHFDNGWNSELAVKNIESIVKKLNIDLFTLVVDWKEFRDLQLAFLKASVVDIEMITDHAIIATLYKLSLKHNIKCILSGTNYVTEAILPPSWIHKKADYIHIRALQKKFVGEPLKSYPLFGLKTRLLAEIRGIKSVSPLNLLPYDKTNAKNQLKDEIGWRDYGGKHHESVFTRFYQGYILPVKFKIDKRKAHLSTLICSGQISREEALAELAKPIYPEELLARDYDFVIKKLGLSKAEFEAIMNTSPRAHADFPIEQNIYDRYPVLKFGRAPWQWFKSEFLHRI
jgi:N-acetyl sugar amidotransferase